MKGAIVYLLNDSEEDKNDFKSSLSGLVKFYIKKHPCDVICFHEKNFPIDELEYLKNLYEINLIFQEIDFKIPNYEEEIIKKYQNISLTHKILIILGSQLDIDICVDFCWRYF